MSALSKSRDYDDDSRHRDTEARGITPSVNTTSEAPIVQQASYDKPWSFPEGLVKSISGETNEHPKKSLFDATTIYGLDLSASNFRAKFFFEFDAFFKSITR